MDQKDIESIRASWEKVKPIQQQVAALFYERLFDIDPELKPLFKDDVTEQGRKLMSMLNTVVVNLDRLDTLIPSVQALGRRHVGYGVHAESYSTVGAALLWTLQTGLGDAFTDTASEAWGKAYQLLAGEMISAAQRRDDVHMNLAGKG